MKRKFRLVRRYRDADVGLAAQSGSAGGVSVPAAAGAEDLERLRRMRARWAIGHLPAVRVADMPQANPEGGVLEGQVVVFTGNLPFDIPRREAWEWVAERGGQPAPNVTKKTTMLVVGDWLEFTLRPGYAVSSKYEKAMGYRTRGIPIGIMDSLLFLDSIGWKA